MGRQKQPACPSGIPDEPGSVTDKIRAWRAKRAAEEDRALTEITKDLCERVHADLLHYANWNYEAVTAETADHLLKLAFTLEYMSETVRVMARHAEYEWKRNIEKANAKA